MERRRVLLAAGALLAAPLTSAAAPSRPWRIGFLTNGTRQSTQGQLDAFRRGLAELGYVEGRDVAIEARYAEGAMERLPALVAELLERGPDIVFAPSGIAAQAMKQSGTKVPIIFAFAPDPVAAGFAASLPRPGGTMTGLTSTHGELSAKRIELLKEVAPRMQRAALLYFLAQPAAGVAEQMAQTEHAAQLLGVALTKTHAPRLEDFESAFADIARQRPDALIVIENPLFYTHRARLTELAAELRIPAVYNAAEYVQAGGLMSYGASYPDLARRAASYVVRILNGQKAGELPVERPTRFELAINLKSARAIGLSVPPAVLLRADAIIG